MVGEAQNQLTSGAEAGLLQVLARVSGSMEVGNSDLITRAARKPSDYYYQYSYESTDRTLQIDDQPVAAQILRLHFEPGSVARLLREAGFPVWGSNRPGVLLWLAVNDGDGRRILSENDESQIASVIQDQSILRGVPLLFPLLDLEDSASLSDSEIWGAFLGRVEDASRRYSPDVILTGRIQKDSVGRWSANWAYKVNQNWRTVDTVSFSADEMARGMMDQLANSLATQYAIDSSQGQVTVSIEGINGIAEYAAVSRYLESLAPVLNSFVVRVQGSELEFKLSTEGQNEQLLEIIALDQKMQLLEVGAGQDLMHFRWIPE